MRARALLLGTLLGLWLTPAGAFAAGVEGIHRIALQSPMLQWNNIATACDSVGELQVCYVFTPRTDSRGKIAATGTGTVTGYLSDGTPVSGEFPVEVTGSIRGVAGDGVTPTSRLALRFRATKVPLTANAEERPATLSSKVAGSVDHTATHFQLAGKRTLSISGVKKKSAGRVTLSFFNTAPQQTWKLMLAIDSAVGGKLSGSALLDHPDGRRFELSVRGTQRRDGTARLTFKPGPELRGSSLAIPRLGVANGAAEFELRFGLSGIKGVASSGGASATWSVVPDDFESQGTYAQPVDITASLPFAGTVGPLEQSYYVIHGLDPNSAYSVELERTTGLTDIWVGIGGSHSCGHRSESLGAIECPTVTDSNGNLRFAVERHEGNLAGGEFTVSFRVGGILDEGTYHEALDITPPHLGHAGTQSYYRITGLVPGSVHTLSVEDQTAETAFEVTATRFQDGRDAHCAFKFGGQGCAFTVGASGEVRLMTSVQGASAGSEYTIRLVDGGLPNQGKQWEPLDATLPREGSVQDSMGSWYRVTGLVAGAPYTGRVRDTSADVQLRLYGASFHQPYPRPECTAALSAGSPTLDCVAVADSAGELVVGIRPEDNTIPASFALSLEAGGLPNEGSYEAPLDVTGQLPRVSSTFNGTSWYKVRNLGSQPVDVSLAIDTPLCRSFYVQDRERNYLCFESVCSPQATCTATPDDGELIIGIGGSLRTPGTFTIDVD